MNPISRTNADGSVTLGIALPPAVSVKPTPVCVLYDLQLRWVIA